MMKVPFISYIGQPHTLIIVNNKIIESSEGYAGALIGSKVQKYLHRLCLKFENELALPEKLYSDITGGYLFSGGYDDPIVTDDDDMHARFFIDFNLDLNYPGKVKFCNYTYSRDQFEYYKTRNQNHEEIVLSPQDAFLILAGEVFTNTASWIEPTLKEQSKFLYTREDFLGNTDVISRLDELATKSPTDKLVKDVGLPFFDYLLSQLDTGRILPIDLLRLNCGHFLYSFLDHPAVQDLFNQIVVESENFGALDLVTMSLYYYFIELIRYDLEIVFHPMSVIIEDRSQIWKDMELSVSGVGRVDTGIFVLSSDFVFDPSTSCYTKTISYNPRNRDIESLTNYKFSFPDCKFFNGIWPFIFEAILDAEIIGQIDLDTQNSIFNITGQQDNISVFMRQLYRLFALSGTMLSETPGTKYIDMEDVMKEFNSLKVETIPNSSIDEKSLIINLTPLVREIVFY